jgi:hypothetical protein
MDYRFRRFLLVVILYLYEPQFGCDGLEETRPGGICGPHRSEPFHTTCYWQTVHIFHHFSTRRGLCAGIVRPMGDFVPYRRRLLPRARRRLPSSLPAATIATISWRGKLGF